MKVYSSTQKRLSYILKLVVAISAITGTFLSAYAGRNSFMGGSRVFMYFTIQSNIAVAITSIVGMCFLTKNRSGDIWNIVNFVATVAITLTGVVFCFVLAPTMGVKAWNPQNILTHVVVPVAAIIDFHVVGISSNIKKRNVFWVVIPPIMYAIYAGIGYALNWQFANGVNYPYFFLNWGSKAGAFGFTNELPYMGCVWWILALFVFLILIGFLYLKIIDILKSKCK